MKAITSGQMRQLEERCAGLGVTEDMLMENAGREVAAAVGRILGDIEQRSVLLVIGPGNNGGDGLVAARHLHDWGASVGVYLLAGRPADDHNLRLARERDISIVEAAADEDLKGLESLLAAANAVVDAGFGTGLSRPFSGLIATVLERIGRARQARRDLTLFALDLPSGLNPDTGEVDPGTLTVDHTITLGLAKQGLLMPPGAKRAGKITVVDIGIPAALTAEVTGEHISEEWVRSVLPARPPQANKGSFGRVLVVAGSINYVGAAYLACSGATRVGAGLVTLATAHSLQPSLASKLTEVTYLPLPESRPGLIAADAVWAVLGQIESYNVLALGCGLGRSPSVTRFVRAVLLGRKRRPLPPLVLDADALNILATVPGWWLRLTDDAVLTPHPGEMARLAVTSVEAVQADREGVAQALALKWRKTIVLKGANTVVAAPDGRVMVSPAVNPGLASAGTGDVLTGAIAGLVAQGQSLFDAAVCGVYLHAGAGEMVRARLGDTGMVASDLLPELPLVIRQVKESKTT